MLPIHRFEEQILSYEKLPVETGKVLLYGSSFFAFWGYERAKKQLAQATNGKLQVVNHGFGGATVEELLYYYHRMVLPYQPSAVVLRTGHNDVWDCSAEEAIILTRRLINWLKNDFPGIRIIALKAFDHPSGLEQNRTALHRYNAMLDALAENDTQLGTVDLNPFFYHTDCETGQHFRDVFLEDGLHLTNSGYEEMTAYLAPKLMELL